MSVPSGTKGTGLPVAQPDRITWDPTRGLVRYQVYDGCDLDDIEALATTARAYGQPYSIRSTGTKHTIEIEKLESSGGGTGYEAMAIDRWEMPGNELEKSIWEHNKLLGTSSRALNAAKRYVEQNKTYAELAADEATLWATLSAYDKAAIQATYALAERQQDHFPVGQYVLRHVTNVGAAYQANVSDNNVEKLYTTAQLLGEVTNPVLWVYPLPPRLKWKIEHLAAPTYQIGFLWSWRKLPSTESTAANGRIEISTEYWLEQWSTWLYETVA